MSHELLHAVAKATGAKRCLLVTTGVTGNPALAGIGIGQFETLVSLRYGGPEIDELARLRSLEVVAREARRLGQFDVAFMDPHHTYRSSVAAFRHVGRRTRRSGWLIAHDCYPPYELAAETIRPGQGAWCGSTYAAFRDVALPSGRAWFVVDDDYGLGVLGPKNTGHLIRQDTPAALAAQWRRADIDAKRELLRESGAQLMRAVPAERVGDMMARLIRNEPVDL